MGWIKNITKVPQKVGYCQNGESNWLKYIFDNIGSTNEFFIDIGAWDGTHLSNTKLFREMGWLGLLIDGKTFPGVYKSFVTKENIISTLELFNTPTDFDLLSIDIDGNDYWILREVLSKYKPRVIISEFNSEHPPTESKTIEYDPKFDFHPPTDYYGYTYGAGLKLAKEFGYTIIFQNSNTNIYYLRNDLVTEQPEFEVNLHRHWNVASDKKWLEV